AEVGGDQHPQRGGRRSPGHEARVPPLRRLRGAAVRSRCHGDGDGRRGGEHADQHGGGAPGARAAAERGGALGPRTAPFVESGSRFALHRSSTWWSFHTARLIAQVATNAPITV